MPIDATFGFAFFDIEAAFEIMVLCFFRDFSKCAQAYWDKAVICPMKAFAGRNKTNMGAREIAIAHAPFEGVKMGRCLGLYFFGCGDIANMSQPSGDTAA